MLILLLNAALVAAIFAVVFRRLISASFGLTKARRLAEARADLAYCASSIQRHMANGTVKHGELVHDLFCRFVNEAQYMDRYINLSGLLISSAERQQFREIHARLDDELARLPNDMVQLARHFQKAFVTAAIYRHPFQFAAWILVHFARRGFAEFRATLRSMTTDLSRVIGPGRLAAAAISLGVLVAMNPSDGLRRHAPEKPAFDAG